jgi:hypothetical protein
LETTETSSAIGDKCVCEMVLTLLPVGGGNNEQIPLQGASVQRHGSERTQEPPWSGKHINVLELRAVRHALSGFGSPCSRFAGNNTLCVPTIPLITATLDRVSFKSHWLLLIAP